MQQVQTLLPDSDYNSLKGDLEKAKNHQMYEKFTGDEFSTKIWLTDDGKILSKMPNEDFIKEILPNSTFANTKKKFYANTELAKFSERLVDRGVNKTDAMTIAIRIYNNLKLDKNMHISDEIMDALDFQMLPNGDYIPTLVLSSPQ